MFHGFRSWQRDSWEEQKSWLWVVMVWRWWWDLRMRFWHYWWRKKCGRKFQKHIGWSWGIRILAIFIVRHHKDTEEIRFSVFFWDARESMCHNCWKINTRPYSLHQTQMRLMRQFDIHLRWYQMTWIICLWRIEIEAALTRIEVKAALKQMAPLKAPRPDGMPLVFYQHCWPSIGGDIIDSVLSCLN